MAPGEDLSNQRLIVGIAHALFMNRLHLLRLTEVVRLGIRPDEDGDMHLTDELEEEMRQQAIAYVLAYFPREYTAPIKQAMKDWILPA